MDMWQPYKDIAETYFKNATIIIDKFHFIRQVTWAFERIRKDEQKKFTKERRRYFKRSRSLLLKRMKYLTPEEIDQVNVMLATSEKLQKAYMLKEKFYNFVDSSDLESTKKNLKAWYMFVMSCELEEFDKCSRTIFNWFSSTGRNIFLIHLLVLILTDIQKELTTKLRCNGIVLL